MPMTILFLLHQLLQIEMYVGPAMPPKSHPSVRYANHVSDLVGYSVTDPVALFVVEIASNPVPDWIGYHILYRYCRLCW